MRKIATSSSHFIGDTNYIEEKRKLSRKNNKFKLELATLYRANL
jgi:hypothetical protein